MSGKNRCKILKEIRQRIAYENDIPLITSECRYSGNCKGTCPKCEAELAYLENELLKRQKAGKTIVIAGLATASLLLMLKGCDTVADEIRDALDTHQTQGAVSPIEYSPEFRPE